MSIACAKVAAQRFAVIGDFDLPRAESPLN